MASITDDTEPKVSMVLYAVSGILSLVVGNNLRSEMNLSVPYRRSVSGVVCENLMQFGRGQQQLPIYHRRSAASAAEARAGREGERRGKDADGGRGFPKRGRRKRCARHPGRQHSSYPNSSDPCFSNSESGEILLPMLWSILCLWFRSLPPKEHPVASVGNCLYLRSE